MGNSNSCHIELESTDILVGTTLKGKLHLHVVDAINTKSVYLKITGREFVGWNELVETPEDDVRREREKDTYRHSHRKRREYSVEIMKAECPLAKGAFEAGAYAYPFEVVLPHGLPQTMQFDQDHVHQSNKCSGHSASVAYQMQAVAHTKGLFSKNVKSKSIKFALHHPPSVPTGPVREEADKLVNTCFCMSAGVVSGSLVLPTSMYLVGGDLPFEASVSNLMKKPIILMEAKLLQTVSLKGKEGALSTPHSAVHGMPTSVSVPFPPPALQPGGKGEVQFRIQLPQTLTPTCNNVMIKVEYRLEIEGKMGTARNNYRVGIPVIIDKPLPPALQQLHQQITGLQLQPQQHYPQQNGGQQQGGYDPYKQGGASTSDGPYSSAILRLNDPHNPPTKPTGSAYLHPDDPHNPPNKPGPYFVTTPSSETPIPPVAASDVPSTSGYHPSAYPGASNGYAPSAYPTGGYPSASYPTPALPPPTDSQYPTIRPPTPPTNPSMIYPSIVVGGASGAVGVDYGQQNDVQVPENYYPSIAPVTFIDMAGGGYKDGKVRVDTTGKAFQEGKVKSGGHVNDDSSDDEK